MSLRDEHLQQALKNAPDKDVAPSDAVRQKVLGYADKAVNPTLSGFFARGIKRFNDWRITSWQLVGMSTVASVLLVTVMLRDQLPDETLWLDDDEQDIAQTKSEPVAAGEPQQDKLARQNEARSETVADDTGVSLSESIAEKEVVSRSKDTPAKAKQKDMRAKTPKPLAKKAEKAVVGLTEKKDVVETSSPPETPMATAVEERLDRVESTDLAGLEMADEISVETERPRAAAKASVAARKQTLPMTKGMSGEVLAKKDIQAGNLRILSTGDSRYKSEPMVDAETGYRVELSSLPSDEVDAYNQTMRDWYHAKQMLSN